jgi:hypothetical protein
MGIPSRDRTANRTRSNPTRNKLILKIRIPRQAIRSLATRSSHRIPNLCLRILSSPKAIISSKRFKRRLSGRFSRHSR